MLLFSKQWSRVAGCILAALIFLFTLRSLDIIRPYPELLNHFPGAISKDQNQGTNGGSKISAGLDLEGALDTDAGFDIPSPIEPSAALTSAEKDTSVSSLAEVTSTTRHHIFLEGTRRPDAVPTTLSTEANVPANPTSSETISNAEPAETSFRKTIVMGKLSVEDTEWVGEMKEWQSAIYTVDLADNETSPTGFKTAVNKAKEATPYLTYLVEHYDTFPDVAVFVHAHRNGWPAAWHNDAKGYDAVNMLNQLRMDTVLDRGFVNLRCIGDPGCPAEIQLNREPPDQSRQAEIAYPYVYSDFFNMTIEDVKAQVPIVATPCCAQFAVSRSQVMRRPKSEYERYLQLIRDSKYDDETLGTVLEYTWHILFGQDAVHCENTQQCWKVVYGREDGWNNFGKRH